MRKPGWLKIELPKGENYRKVQKAISSHGLHTICESGKCPNMGECWDAGTATFMILGDICTRSCRFCATHTGKPLPPDAAEPLKVAHSIRQLALKHVVITSVDRDDLPDGGASHWADTIQRVREINPQLTIEALVPDFGGNLSHLDVVIDSRPNILSHNIETVSRLTPQVRSAARYGRSLTVLAHIAKKGIKAKSGLMVGLGETFDEVMGCIADLRKSGCAILTIGQYLQPSPQHIAVQEYIHPDLFEKYRLAALDLGFEQVESKPLVRSSYHAEKHVQPRQQVQFSDLGTLEYQLAWDKQEALLQTIVDEKHLLDHQHLPTLATKHYVLFVEHPHVYTLGKSGSETNLLADMLQLAEKHATFVKTNRGGDITYHGPGQIVGYPILNLEAFVKGVKEYVWKLEESIIRCVAHYGIRAERLEGATGVWLEPHTPGLARKICAMGVRVSRGVSMHGFALNVNTDLSYFDMINPCGFTDKRVTSLQKELGMALDMDEVKSRLREALQQVFGMELITN